MVDIDSPVNDIEVSKKTWFSIFFPLAWSGHTGLGLAIGVFGPTQPYLAQNVSVDVGTINYIWTGRSIGVCITAIIAALVFRRNFRSTSYKLTFLAIAEIITGVFVIMTPFVYDFPLLIAMVTVYGMGLGLFDTADNSFIVYMLGPTKSRPFTQSLHAFVGVGFILGSFLVQPFLPEENTNDMAVCPGLNATKHDRYTPTLIGGISSINWPYIIIGIWHFLTATGLLVLGSYGKKLPQIFFEDSRDQEFQAKTFTNVKFWKTLLVMVYMYYFFSCGLEGFFQSMTYTYGLCGPLKMHSEEAAWLNSLYFGAFVFGRCSGIIISKYLEPSKLIVTSLLGCVLSTLLLSIMAGTSKICLYIGTCMMGFAVSFQFASGISWTANLFNVTGKASFIFFLGAYSGFLSIPPVAGEIFTTYSNKVGFFYLSLAITILHMLLFISMMQVSKFKNANKIQNI